MEVKTYKPMIGGKAALIKINMHYLGR